MKHGNMEHITLILGLFIFLDSVVSGTFISIPKRLQRVRTSLYKESTARGAVCQHTGTRSQSTPLHPEPADGEETLPKARYNRLLVPGTTGAGHLHLCTCTSPADTISPPEQVGEPHLAQLPHKSRSAPQAIAATTSPSVSVNFNAQLQ